MTSVEPSFLRTRVCSTCPFRGGFHLDRSRRAEIHHSVMVDDQTFRCHSEVDYSGEDEGVHDTTARQCAGATTLASREGSSNQLMRLEERLGVGKIIEDPSVPFETWADWVMEPEYSTARFGKTGTGEACHVVGASCLHPAGWMGGSGVAENYAADAEQQCPRCGEPTCDECMDGEICADCGEWEK